MTMYVKRHVPRELPKTALNHQEEILKIKENVNAEYEKFMNAQALINDSSFFQILQNKIQGMPARAFFAYRLFEYLKSSSSINLDKIYKTFFERQLPFILEAIISIQYYHNQILDAKAGVNTPEKINLNLIIANLLKEQLYRYLEKLKISEKDKKALIKTVRSIFEQVDIGQYIEKHCNTYEAYQSGQLNHPFQHFVAGAVEEDTYVAEVLQKIEDSIQQKIKIDRADFLHLYLQRIYLTNTSLYKLISEFIADVLKVADREKGNAVKFAISFGMMHQIVNDNADFVPSCHGECTVSKIEQDAFSDLKNRNITLPTLIYLQLRPGGKIAQILKSANSNIRLRILSSEETNIFNEITQSLAIYYAMTVGKKIKDIARDHLSRSSDSLEDMLKIAENNRYYQYFYKTPYHKSYQKAIRKKKPHRKPNPAAIIIKELFLRKRVAFAV